MSSVVVRKGMPVLFYLITWLVIRPAHADDLMIAVAADLDPAMKQIVADYERVSGDQVKVSYGASSNLARRILQGARFRLFIPAGSEAVDFLVSRGVIQAGSAENFVDGKLGLYVPNGSVLSDMEDTAALLNALKYAQFRRIAIANPEQDQFGVAALQALRNGGIWSLQSGRVLQAEDIAGVIPYALSGDVDLAVIPAAFMSDTAIALSGRYYPLPDDWYTAPRHHVVILEDDPATRRFRDYLFDAARETLLSYGYRYP